MSVQIMRMRGYVWWVELVFFLVLTHLTVRLGYIEDACEKVYKCAAAAASVTSSSTRLEALLNATCTV